MSEKTLEDHGIEFGSKYRDIVSGFEGIAVAVHSYMNGCVQVSLSPKVTKDKKKPESWSFDIQQVEKCSAGHVLPKLRKNREKLSKAAARKPGGAAGPSPEMQH